MSPPRRYPGLAASPGSAAGLIYRADAAADPGADPATAVPAATASAATISAATPAQVEAAFAAVAAGRRALAERLRAATAVAWSAPGSGSAAASAR